MEKKRPQLEPRKLPMTKLISKDKHTVKAGNHPHTNIKSKSAMMRREEYKCKMFKMHLQLRDQQLKAIIYIKIYRETAILKTSR